MQFWPSLALAACVLCATAASPQAPRITSIDPPNWWIDMPAPMLLLHGEHLNNAALSVRGRGVRVAHTQASANGHWLFVWLQTADAAPQTLRIVARNTDGQASRSYTLAARKHDPHAHQGFSAYDVMYLIMTDRFADGDKSNDPASDNRSAPRGWHGGDFAGIEQHLDYLQQLGVTSLWTTPVDSNGAMPESYHGYAATDLYSVDPHFGTLQEYRRLSDALHKRGMKLVIDLVPNHIGVLHPWVLDPPAPNWLHGTLQHHSLTQSDFYQLIDPHAPPCAWQHITDGWFTDQMPDLNQDNPLVAQYLIQNALWWVETAGLDGIRFDTFPYVDRAFWHQLDATLHQVYPHLTTVGEIFHRDPEVTSYFAGGVSHLGVDTELYTPFDFPVYFTLRNVLAHGHPMTELATVLRQDVLYPHPERLATFIGNHDTTRFITEDGGSLPRLKLALGLMLTLRGMPLIYSGDEIAMPGGADPENRHDFPGGFPGDAHNAFTLSGRTPAQQQTFQWTSSLIAYRHAHDEFTSGIQQNLHAGADTFAFVRAASASGCATDHSTERLLIVVNKATESRSIDLTLDGTALAGCAKFTASQPAPGPVPQLNRGRLHVEAPAQSLAIYSVR